MGDVDILPAIAVYVGGVDAHSCFVPAVLACRHPRYERDVVKFSIVLVDEKKIWPRVVSDRDIGPAVVVEIGQHHAHPFRHWLAHAGSVTHVSEGAIMIVVVELGLLPFVVAGMAV